MSTFYVHTWRCFNAIVMFLFISLANSYANYSLENDTLLTTKAISPLVVQVEMENGGMLASNPVIKEKFNDIYYNAVNVRVGWQTKPHTDEYHQRYHYPVYGVGFYSSSFSKKEIGTPYALFGFVAIPIAPHWLRKWDFDYRIGLGLANNFEPYNPERNPTNILLGTHHNVFIDFGLQANYRITPRWQLGAGFAFHHFSNGSLRQPNKGINLIPFTAAITYRLGGIQEYTLSEEMSDRIPYHENAQLHFQYAAGIKQFNPDDERRYFKSTLSGYWSHSVGPKWRLGAGVDVFYAASGDDPSIAKEKAGKISALFSGGPAFYIDHVLTQRLYLNGNIGWYAHRNTFNGETKPIFLRIGARYKVFDPFYTGVSIKAHMGKADFIEWTVGYSFQKNR